MNSNFEIRSDLEKGVCSELYETGEATSSLLSVMILKWQMGEQ